MQKRISETFSKSKVEIASVAFLPSVLLEASVFDVPCVFKENVVEYPQQVQFIALLMHLNRQTHRVSLLL